MKKLLYILSVLIIASMVLTACGGVAATKAPVATQAPVEEPADPNALPREQTLYFNGLQWKSVVSWNPYSSDTNNAMVVADGPTNPSVRVPMFETPYMFNMLNGKYYPLLADGDYAWNADRTEITFKIKAAAHWNDATPVTAEDVAYTWASNVKYSTTNGNAYKDYIDTVEAKDPQTVVVKAKLDANGKPVNPLQVIAYLSDAYVIQKAWTQKVEVRTGGDPAQFRADAAEDVVSSGPYQRYFVDDSKVVLIRDDNYWGQDASMWGKLPVPKYLAHVIYSDNNAGFAALQAGEVDVSQQFNSNVQELWLKDNLPVSTYLAEAPYMVASSIPTAWYNLKSYGLDNVAVRKAIAMAVDYDTIIANAMTDQSPTFNQVPRSLMNPTDGEQALYDHDAVKDLQWTGNDIEGAKKLLDDAGIKDTDGDGWRELDGKKLTYNAVCPAGWSDWQAAMEIVASAGQKIGIDITTNFPDFGVYQTVFTDGEQTDYDIFMWSGSGASPTQPWARVRQFMSSEFAGTKNNWNGNYGGYVNPAADKLIQAIPSETDPAKLKEYYTELTKIYLSDVPSFALMYRPDLFHTVNESVWTNFPNAEDGLNIPPTVMINGYGIAGLYNLELVSSE
ncbi:MAG TPA: ABC transporter substrate-binding protein [Anaerolineales bacterium]